MPLSFRRKPQFFDVPLEDMVLRIKGPPTLYEEARAAGMAFWEQLQSYLTRQPQFRTSKAPLSVPSDAPEIIRRMAEMSALAGVGPVFTFQGAATEAVGRAMAQRLPDVMVSSGGDYFVLNRKPARLVVHPAPNGDQQDIAVVVKPELGALGVYTTMGAVHLPARVEHGIVVVATSCILAEAAAAGAMAILSKPASFRPALRYLQGVRGVHGAILLGRRRIGVAGSLELAA